MGQKSNPIILRLNKTNQHWNSCWYSDDDYATPFIEDCKINPYINSSQQQLERFPPVSFVKRQRGDLQVALFSAKRAQQFTKFKLNKHNKYKNLANHLITHNIFKKWANYEKPIYKSYTPYSGLMGIATKKVELLRTKIDRSSPTKLTNASTTFLALKKKECLRLQLFLAIISKYDALKVVPDNMAETKVPLHMLCKKNPSLFAREIPTKPLNLATRDDIKKTTVVRIVDPTRNHLEYSMYKYYNEYDAPFTPVRSKIYLIKSPTIYQNPLFLASQVVSLLEERAVFRQIKHRVVREIRKNPIIKGVRIICSGRVASRSKKAQKARRESIQWGATSLNVFSEHVNFASCFAQSAFGKIGVKVWISYNLMAH